MTQLLAGAGRGYDGSTRRCACGGQQATDHYATSTRQTVVGSVTLQDTATLNLQTSDAGGTITFDLYGPTDPSHLSSLDHEVVNVNGTDLIQILLNLAGNSVKFTDDGEILIRAELEAESPGEVSVRFAVTDSGVGIPDEARDTVF